MRVHALAGRLSTTFSVPPGWYTVSTAPPPLAPSSVGSPDDPNAGEYAPPGTPW